jgi:hypothetical protein
VYLKCHTTVRFWPWWEIPSPIISPPKRTPRSPRNMVVPPRHQGASSLGVYFLFSSVGSFAMLLLRATPRLFREGFGALNLSDKPAEAKELACCWPPDQPLAKTCGEASEARKFASSNNRGVAVTCGPYTR